MEAIKVNNISIVRTEIDKNNLEIKDAMKAIFNTTDPNIMYPLTECLLSINVSGIYTAYAHAITRVMCDELRGMRLNVNIDEYQLSETSDQFMNEYFIRGRVNLIPLRIGISAQLIKDVSFTLRGFNDTFSSKVLFSGDLEIVSGNITEPIFNPCHSIGFIQPGKTILIENIKISEGYGYKNAAFCVCLRGVTKPLDIKRNPKSVTHNPIYKQSITENREIKKQASKSGYTESSLVANPKHHLITVVIPACPANNEIIRNVPIDACINLKERLKRVQNVLKNYTSEKNNENSQAQFVVNSMGDNIIATLTIKGETATLGMIIKRSIHELVPDIAYVGSTCTPHDREMKLTISHAIAGEDIKNIVLRGIKHSYGIFDTIQKGIETATIVDN